MSPEELEASFDHLRAEICWYVEKISEACGRYSMHFPRVTVVLRDPDETETIAFVTNEGPEDLPAMYAQLMTKVQRIQGGER